MTKGAETAHEKSASVYRGQFPAAPDRAATATRGACAGRPLLK